MLKKFRLHLIKQMENSHNVTNLTKPVQYVASLRSMYSSFKFENSYYVFDGVNKAFSDSEIFVTHCFEIFDINDHLQEASRAPSDVLDMCAVMVSLIKLKKVLCLPAVSSRICQSRWPTKCFVKF